MRASAIFVPNDHGYDRLPIFLAPDGSFSVSGIPAGRYLLQIDTLYPADSRGVAGTHTQLVELTTSTPIFRWWSPPAPICKSRPPAQARSR